MHANDVRAIEQVGSFVSDRVDLAELIDTHGQAPFEQRRGCSVMIAIYNNRRSARPLRHFSNAKPLAVDYRRGPLTAADGSIWNIGVLKRSTN
jgi:hypothetical protein